MFMENGTEFCREKSMETDTIVALATREGTAGLAVVRVSGPDAVAVARRVFQGAGFESQPTSHVAVYGILINPAGDSGTGYDPIDQVLALPLLAPRSYTGEDTVEFFCHGGRAVARQVVAACRAAGARPAAAGEFTRRAFLNGKLSLDQAEAVADLIHAESRHAARAAVGQLLGGLNRQLGTIEEPLLNLLGRIEGGLEFLEEEEMDVSAREVARILEDSMRRISDLLEMGPAGRLLRDGIQVVLTGPVNVGKSSLFNALVGEERAIVDEEAGTTRDIVSAAVERNGIRFVFQDTAGLRKQAGGVEKKGMARTARAVAEADIVLVLAESGPEGRTETVSPGPENDSAVVIHVMTKSDLAEPRSRESRADAIFTSSVDGRGLPRLWAALQAAVETFRLDEAVAMGVVLNERHLHKLQECRNDLALLLTEVTGEASPGVEVVGTMLASILGRFGEISGRVFSEQLLEAVFNRFCVGK